MSRDKLAELVSRCLLLGLRSRVFLDRPTVIQY